jgi:eukaryotic-like serine/threonine-protein kinase
VSQSRSYTELVAASSGDSLPPEAVILQGRRLGTAAALSACLHLIYLALYSTLWVALSNPISMTTSVLGLVISVATALYFFSGRRSPARVAAVGLTYEVLLALSLSISEAWASRYSGTSSQVSWSAVVIVLFPFLTPARPRLVFAASVLAAAMTPLAMALVFGLTGRAWPALGVVASYVLPPFLCAVLAWAPTSVLSQMSAAIKHARRLGSYELTERLGAGGMGEVWLATHRLLARPAAVKLIKPEVLGAKDTHSRDLLIRRFEREAQVTASLESPHTVELYDFGVSSEGVLFYVMELLHGVDLETLINRFGPLPSERVIYLLTQACDSLEDAHGRGLIHRDIKPANLFVARKGGSADFLKLLDFGLVKRWSGSDEDHNLLMSLQESAALVGETAVGQIVGTPAFLAPEAALGEKAVDHRADLYSLGCVGYWMLTGKLVFTESTVMGMAVAHVTREPEPPSKSVVQLIAPGLEAAIMSCLQKDRSLRPQSAEALRETLTAVSLQEPWSRERANNWWREHLPSKPAP